MFPYDLLVDGLLGLGRILVGGLFLAAGAAKLRAGGDPFLRRVLAYDLLPPWAATLLGRWLPWAEVVAGSVLMLGLAPTSASLVGATLLVIFAVAMGINVRRGRAVECGCLGATGQVRGRFVWRNLALAALLLAGGLRGENAVSLAAGLGWLAPGAGGLATAPAEGAAWLATAAVVAGTLHGRRFVVGGPAKARTPGSRWRDRAARRSPREERVT